MKAHHKAPDEHGGQGRQNGDGAPQDPLFHIDPRPFLTCNPESPDTEKSVPFD